MASFKFKNVCIESFAYNLPDKEVTSLEVEKELEPLYKRLGIPFGTLEKLTGVQARRFWENSVMPSQVATVAALKALEQVSFPRQEIRALLSCSITRDYFEPATACLIHNALGIQEDSFVADVSNACLGFMDGILMLSNMIESGQVKAGIVTSGEVMSKPIRHGIKHMAANQSITRDELIKLLPTLTLGAGAVAYVLCHQSIASKGAHKVLGGATKSATQYHDLCNGNGDYFFAMNDEDFSPIMTTESQKLIAAAASLGGRTWKEASEVLGWSASQVDHIFCHQVGKQVNEAFYAEMALDMKKEFTIYKKLGNLASAAVPTALIMGAAEKGIKSGEKVVLTGFGSGLNSLFLGIEW